MPDPIAETDQRFQELVEQRLPTPAGTDAFSSAMRSSIYSARGTGATRGGTTTTDSPDLIGQAIQARQNFEARRSALINRLPNARHGEARSIAAELHGIDANERQLDYEANQRRIQAHTNALEADKHWKTDRETDIDEDGHGMIQALGYLKGALRNGRITQDQYHDGLLDAGQRYPMAMRHPEAARAYQFDISEADKVRDFAERRNVAEAVKLGSKYGVPVQMNEATSLPDLEATRALVTQSDKFKQEQITGMNKEMMQKYGVGTGVASLFNPVAPHTSPDNNKTIDIPFTDPKDGAIKKHNVPMALFNQMKADFQDRYYQVVPQGTREAAQPKIANIDSKADYDKLAPGSEFMSGGKRYRKPAENP